MSTQGRAVRLASRLSEGKPQPVSSIELAAFEDHPEVLVHMGDGGRRWAKTSGPGKRLRLAGAGVGLVLVLLLLAAPVVGLAAILGDPSGFHRMRASQSVPIAGVSFAVAAVVQAVSAVVWWRQGRARFYMWSILAFGTVLFAAATWVVMGNAAALDGGVDATPWRIPVVLAGLVALAFGVLQLVAGRRAEPKAPEPVDRDEEAARRAAIAALPEEERAAILDDRNRALQVLVERGCLRPELAEVALAAELGTLHLVQVKEDRR